MTAPKEEKTRKIAIVGTAPSSVMKGPYNDPSWTLWVCSRGNTDRLPRIPDEWFEIHDLERKYMRQSGKLDGFNPEYFFSAFELLFALEKLLWLSINNNIHIVYYLNEPIHIKSLGLTINHEDEEVIMYTDQINVDYGNETYTYTFVGPFDIELIIICKK